MGVSPIVLTALIFQIQQFSTEPGNHDYERKSTIHRFTGHLPENTADFLGGVACEKKNVYDMMILGSFWITLQSWMNGAHKMMS